MASGGAPAALAAAPPQGRQGLLRRDAAAMTAAGGASLRAIAQEAGRRHGVAVPYLAVRTALRRPADGPIVPRHREAADDSPRRPS